VPGNNAVEMQTTATYDASSQQFIIHSPTTLSQVRAARGGRPEGGVFRGGSSSVVGGLALPPQAPLGREVHAWAAVSLAPARARL
jgi:hypothetical protein